MRPDRLPLHFSNLDQLLMERTHGFLVCVLFGLVALVYVNSLEGWWIFDDLPNIVNNPRLHLERLDWQSISGTFLGMRDSINRPLAYFSFGLNFYFHQLDVLGYHLVNLGIHILATLTLYLFLLKVLHLPINQRYANHAKAIAFLGTLLWATSPIQVTAVTFIIQRMASMAALFFILSMLCYLLARTTTDQRRRFWWFGLCILTGLLSLASKENAVMLPIVLYVMDLLLIRGPSKGLNRRTLLHDAKFAAVPIAIVAVISLVLTSPQAIVQDYNARDFSLVERLLTQPRVLLFYLSQMLLPIPERFTLIHDIQVSTSLWHPWTTLPAILFWIGWAGLGIFLTNKRPFVAFALVFFLLNHAVESSFLPLELIYEHRNYLPTMLLYPLVAIGILWVGRKLEGPAVRAAVAFATVAFIALQSYTVMERNALFAHPILVWEDNLAKISEQSRIYTNLGQVYQVMGMPKKARESYEKALEVDHFHRPSLKAVPLGNLGNSYLRVGDYQQAKAYYQQALVISPSNIRVRIGLLTALLRLGELETAGVLLEEDMRQFPNSNDLLLIHATLQFKRELYPSAIEAATKVIATDPRHPVARRVLGTSHLRLGEHDEAEHHWQSIADTDPNDVEATLTLLKLAELTGDAPAQRRAVRRLDAIRRGRSWDELLGQLDAIHARNGLVFLENPTSLLPLIKRVLADRAG